jgi:DNA-directed RNA polymerase subunit F
VEGGEMREKLLNSISNILETQLKRQNEILQQMLDIMPKPEGKFRKIMETAVLFIGTFGIINLIDVILKWVIGG